MPALQGRYFLPELRHEGYLGRIGRGTLLDARELSADRCLVLATGGAACFTWSSPEPVWEIECPTAAADIHLASGKLALADQKIVLWSLDQPDSPQILAGHDGETVRQVLFSPDGSLLYSVGEDLVLRVWEVATCQLLRMVEERATPFALRPDGKVAACFFDRSLTLWDIQSGLQLGTVASEGVVSLAFDESGDTLAGGDRHGTITLWMGKGLEPFSSWTAHSDQISALRFSPDGLNLVSAGDDSQVKIWSLASYELKATLEGHNDSVWSVDFGQTRLLTTGADLTVRAWKNGQEEARLEPTQPWTCSAAFSRDGRQLATGGLDGSVRLAPSSSPSLARQLRAHSDAVNALTFSPDGSWLASGSEDTRVRLHSLVDDRTWELLHESGVAALAFSDDGKILASADSDRGITLWNPKTGERLTCFEGTEGAVEQLLFEPGSRKLLALYDEGAARFWKCDGW